MEGEEEYGDIKVVITLAKKSKLVACNKRKNKTRIRNKSKPHSDPNSKLHHNRECLLSACQIPAKIQGE